MWRRLVPPGVHRQLDAGAELLRETPGSRGLLGGAAITGIIALVAHPQGPAAGLLRAALALPVIILFLAAQGELAAMWRDVRRMRVLLVSAPSGRGPLSPGRRLVLVIARAVLFVSRRPASEQIANDKRPQQGADSEPVEDRARRSARVANTGVGLSCRRRRARSTRHPGRGRARSRS